DRRGETFDRRALSVLAGDEANLARSPLVEIVAHRLQSLRLVVGDLEENLVGLDRVDQPLRRSSGELLPGCVRGTGVLQPQVAVEHREDLRGEVAALGEQVPGALAANGDLASKLGPEYDQRFGVEATVLDESERQSIDAGAPGHVGEAFAGRDQG